ncbi:Uncharacterised protein [Salmonella enterica subsp. arizonae]|uniref:Uncharacterized protein n=1 Tax=Salmonella enterica subsp. arizonae TaxID=59203 RepID=A0A379S6V7_SALER|nr:Uncharacterised protein [Salmonella enterica subsp. arizonae]
MGLVFVVDNFTDQPCGGIFRSGTRSVVGSGRK